MEVTISEKIKPSKISDGTLFDREVFPTNSKIGIVVVLIIDINIIVTAVSVLS